jgi:hypothetical protein
MIAATPYAQCHVLRMRTNVARGAIQTFMAGTPSIILDVCSYPIVSLC